LIPGTTGNARKFFSIFGLCRVKVIPTIRETKALEEAGLEITERVSIEVEPSEPAAKYLRTKKEKMGHLLNVKAS